MSCDKINGYQQSIDSRMTYTRSTKKHTWTIPMMMKSEEQQNGNQQQKVVQKACWKHDFYLFKQ